MGCSWTPLERGSFTRGLSRILHAGMPAAKRTSSTRITDPAAEPGDRRRPLRAEALRRRHGHGSRRRLLGRPREAARRRPLPLAERAQVARSRDAPDRRPPQRRPLGGHLRASGWPGNWEFSVEAWIDLFATWRDEMSRKIAAAQDDLSGELSEGAVLVERALEKAKGADTETLSRSLAMLARRERRRPGALRRGALARARRGDGARPGPPRRDAHGEGAAARRRPRAGAVRLLVRGLPALVGRLEGRRGDRARAGRDGLRRGLHDADPPDRRHQPQGPQQHARRRPGRPRLAVRGRRQGGRPRRRPPGARHRRGRPLAVRHRARARHGRVHGLRHQRLRRPPVADRAPRVVPPPPGRDAQVRREPAQEVPGHLQRQLGVRGLARPVGGVAADLPVLGRRRREGLPRRQPAHEAVRSSGSG